MSQNAPLYTTPVIYKAQWFECVLSTTHEKGALLKMAAGSRFAEVDQQEINQTMDDATPQKTKR